jgi:HK97 family phage portal protein
MKLLDRVAGAWHSFIYGPRLNQRDAGGGLVYGGPRQSAMWPNYDLDGQVARAFRLAVVQACIDAIARDVSAAPLRVYRETENQPKEQPTHAARIVVRDPNPAMSESEFWYFVVAMAAATGFCVVEKVRSGAGRPVELWPLISPWLKVKPKPQQMPDWEYRVPGNDPWPLAAEDVIVVTYRPDAWGGWTGRTPLSSLKRELAIDDQMTDFLNLLFDRGGVPPVGLRAMPQGESKTVPKFDQAEVDSILGAFAQKYGGAGNWHKPVFLGGFAVERIGLDLGEMLFPQVREHIELHICTAFGVPAGMIGTAAGLARNTYSNAETDLRKYYDGTIAPLWARLDGAFTRGLLREFDPAGALSMGFDTSEIKALEEDEKPRWERATSGLGAGLITLNQAQAEVGLPGFGPNGEVLYLPFSVVVIKPTDLLAEAEPKPVPEPLAPVPVVDDEDDEGEPVDDPDGEERALRRLSRRRREIVHTRSKATIAKLSRRGASMLRTFWKAQGARIADTAIRTAKQSILHRDDDGTPRVVGFGDPPTFAESRDIADIDWDAEEAELAKVLNRFYVLNGETAFAAVADQLGIGDIAWDLANPNVRRVMDYLGQRIVGISDTTREDVQRVVTEALEEGVTTQELSERLSGLFEETYRSRAATVARTESQVAYNSANVLGYEVSGQIAYVELLDNPDHGGYGGDGDGLTCAERNGMIVALGDAHIHIEGTHPNCVLAIAPVLSTALGEGN